MQMCKFTNSVALRTFEVECDGMSASRCTAYLIYSTV